jgi:Na+/H+-dicarboxylate symporter/ABC-type amino acid transport substrate-binding protein
VCRVAELSVPSLNTTSALPAASKPKRTGVWISAGLLLGVLCGVLFGEYCAVLEVLGQAYVGLLQMTVLPYLVLSLIAKLGRLNAVQAGKLGRTAIVVLLIFWLSGIALVVLASAILPPIQGASFFSPAYEEPAGELDFLETFVPTNIFHSLSSGLVPAVVVFCLLAGIALIRMPGKEPLLDFMDLCTMVVGRINLYLVRLAPIGLFVLTAAAAGTLQLEELARLQGYLIVLTLCCVVAAFGILPLLVSGLTEIRYRDLLKAAHEPLLTVIATGKLFVVLPQIVDKCEQLQLEGKPSTVESGSTASVMVPLAYPFPHLGKILAFVFISFAAWYSGHSLTPAQTTAMAATGTVSSFASPLITMPLLLDQYKLSQDLMALFILPGFVTMRLGDIVGVMHLMALTLIVNEAMLNRLRVRWRRLLVGAIALLLCMLALGAASRWHLSSTTLEYDLDDRLLGLKVPLPHHDVIVHKSSADIPARHAYAGSTLERVKTERLLRVGYHPDHLPFSFFNQQQQLVGLDVELMHRLATRLDVRLKFIPYSYDTLATQLESGEIDVAIGGLMMTPERLLLSGFTQPYQTATIAIALPDHRRDEFNAWHDSELPANLRLAVVYEDVAAAARRELPNAEIVVIDSVNSFFTEHKDLDGLIISAEEGAAWNVLYPEFTVVVPKPIIQRPVCMAVRLSDTAWLRFLDRWLEFEQLDGSLDRLRKFWIEGDGTQEHKPRWCVIRDVLHWVP